MYKKGLLGANEYSHRLRYNKCRVIIENDEATVNHRRKRSQTRFFQRVYIVHSTRKPSYDSTLSNGELSHPAARLQCVLLVLRTRSNLNCTTAARAAYQNLNRPTTKAQQNTIAKRWPVTKNYNTYQPCKRSRPTPPRQPHKSHRFACAKHSLCGRQNITINMTLAHDRAHTQQRGRAHPPATSPRTANAKA